MPRSPRSISGAGDGATGFLSYVFGPDAYARALANGIDPATDNSDSDLQRFADEHIVYNTAYNDAGDNANWGKVRSETLAGAGTYNFSYGAASSTSAGGYDVWVSKATETLSDGSTSVVYSNMAGEPVFNLLPQYRLQAAAGPDCVNVRGTGPAVLAHFAVPGGEARVRLLLLLGSLRGHRRQGRKAEAHRQTAEAKRLEPQGKSAV